MFWKRLLYIIIQTNLVLLSNQIILNDKNSNSKVIINTKYGKLSGFQVPIREGNGTKKAMVFLGVPFAQPPVDKLRFEKPVVPLKWVGVRAAHQFAASCVPFSRALGNIHENSNRYSEDCLYLNIYAPSLINKNNGGYPVLVFIHGGAFEFGNSFDFGYNFFVNHYVKRDIVFITIQYRLAQFGFASDGGRSLPGNNGLWDQTAALKFVRENVADFGGNPQRVTVWGHSAGSASVGLLTLSHHSRGLFENSIQMGASCFGEWALNDHVVEETKNLASVLHCFSNSTQSLKQCFSAKTTRELLDAAERTGTSRRDINFIKFAPRLDSDFFGDDLTTLLDSAPIKPTLTGISDAEALLFTLFGIIRQVHDFHIPMMSFKTFSASSFKKMAAELVANKRNFNRKAVEVLEKICEFYLLNSTAHNPDSCRDGASDIRDYSFYLKQYTKLISDIIFVVPILIESGLKSSKNWPVYLYQLSYFRRDAFPENIPVKCSTHAIEYPYIFGIPVFHSIDNLNEDDARFQENFIDSIVKFVMNGNPTNDFMSINNFSWPVVTNTMPLIHVKLDKKLEVCKTTPFFAETLRFWSDLKKEFIFDFFHGLRNTSFLEKDEL